MPALYGFDHALAQALVFCEKLEHEGELSIAGEVSPNAWEASDVQANLQRSLEYEDVEKSLATACMALVFVLGRVAKWGYYREKYGEREVCEAELVSCCNTVKTTMRPIWTP